MEKSGDTAVFTFGRFNPPTTGHEKLIEACGKQQSKNSGSKMYVYASQSNDPKKNPLPYAKKIAYMRKMYKKYAKNITTGKPRTAIEVAVELYKKGHKAIVMVVGSDRVQEFERLLNDYNGVDGKKHGYYGFDNIEVVSAGERDPDAEGVSGMSASKMRAAAADGDFQSFEMGVPSSFSQRKELYRDVRKGMGMREAREMGDMNDIEYVRDLYLTGKIWNAGDIIEAKGITGNIIRKGTNYVSFADDDGKVHKCWIHEIELNEASALDRLMKFDKSRVAAGKSPIFTDKKGQTFVRMKKSGLMSIMNVPADEIGKFEKKGYKIIENLEERNYRKEYDNYQGTKEQIARRSSRNKARRVMGDKTKIGMDVGHKDNNPLNNDPKNLKNEDPSSNRREPRLREKPEMDESWWNNLAAKVHQMTHPKGYAEIIKKYAEGLKDKKHNQNPGQWASDLAREYGDPSLTGRHLSAYINKLVDKGKLPKELKAEYVPEELQTFKQFVNQFQEDPCWDSHKQIGMKKKDGKKVPNCVPEENSWGEITEKDEKSGKELNNPTKGDVKKYKVYVKNEKGNVVKVEFGDPDMEIKRDDPKNRASFRARHGCDNPGPKWKAKYWSCKFWSGKSVTDLMKG